jgi:hypothetical protein
MNRVEAEETVELEAVSHEAKLNFWAYWDPCQPASVE